jgi:uncharacterized protein YjbJ (UPF0337 family)
MHVGIGGIPIGKPVADERSVRQMRRQKGNDMNWDILEGKWKQYKGKAQTKWGKLTNDDLDKVKGKREQLVGVIQERYGKARNEAEKEADSFCKECCG